MLIPKQRSTVLYCRLYVNDEGSGALWPDPSLRFVIYIEIINQSIKQNSRHHWTPSDAWGSGSLISELITDNGMDASLLRLGVPFNSFTENISADQIKVSLGLNPEGIRVSVKEFISN